MWIAESFAADAIIGLLWFRKRTVSGVNSWPVNVNIGSPNFLRLQSITSDPELLNPLWPVAKRSFWENRSHVVAKFVPTFTSSVGLKGFALISKILTCRSSLVYTIVLSQIHRFCVTMFLSIFLLQIVYYVSISQTLVVQSRPPLTILPFLWLIELTGISCPTSWTVGVLSSSKSKILIIGSLEQVATFDWLTMQHMFTILSWQFKVLIRERLSFYVLLCK